MPYTSSYRDVIYTDADNLILIQKLRRFVIWKYLYKMGYMIL